MAGRSYEIGSKTSRRAFLCAAAGITACRLVPAAENGKAFAYVGSFSFTKGPENNAGAGKGIYCFEVDRTTGVLTQGAVVEDAANPWWLAIHPSKKFLYAANEITAPADTSSGSISAYAIDGTTGALQLLGTVSSHGARPAQLSVHPSGKYLLVANFGSSNMAAFPIKEDGTVSAPSDVKVNSGVPGPHRATSGPRGSTADSGHDKAHPHMVLADPAARFVVESDLGLDELLTWRFDANTGVFTPSGASPVKLPPGDGPRHFAFHPNGRWLYSLQEEGCTVVTFDYNAENGQLKQKSSVSTVPEGFVGSDYTSEIIVSPDGRFVYAVNRLYDSIAYFKVNSDGSLSAAGEAWSHGDFPRHITFDPNHNFLYCCNQRSDAITTFKVNRETGALTFTGQFTAVGTPAILVFLA